MPHPGAATAEPNKWRPLKSRRGRCDLRPAGRRAPGHLGLACSAPDDTAAGLCATRCHCQGRDSARYASPAMAHLEARRRAYLAHPRGDSPPADMTSAPLEARMSRLRTRDTAGTRVQQCATPGPSDVGNRLTNYAPWVRRRGRSSVTAAGDSAACIGHRVRAVRTRTGTRRSSGGTSAVELSGPGRKPPRLPAGRPPAGCGSTPRRPRNLRSARHRSTPAQR